MNKKIKPIVYAVCIATLTTALISCAPSMKIEIANDDSAKMEFSTSLSKSIEGSIRSIMGLTEDAPLYKKEPVAQSLLAAGLEVESIIFPSLTGIELKANIKNINTSLTYAKEAVKVQSNGNVKQAKITMNPEIFIDSLKFMPEQTRTYSDLLMAPVFTGEEMAPDEYLFLLSMVYGDTLAQELANSSFIVELIAPSKIIEASLSDPSLGTVSVDGKKATFSISFYKLLSSSQTTEYLISWAL